jgi:hypothetical protein
MSVVYGKIQVSEKKFQNFQTETFFGALTSKVYDLVIRKRLIFSLIDERKR